MPLTGISVFARVFRMLRLSASRSAGERIVNGGVLSHSAGGARGASRSPRRF